MAIVRISAIKMLSELLSWRALGNLTYLAMWGRLFVLFLLSMFNMVFCVCLDWSISILLVAINWKNYLICLNWLLQKYLLLKFKEHRAISGSWTEDTLDIGSWLVCFFFGAFNLFPPTEAAVFVHARKGQAKQFFKLISNLFDWWIFISHISGNGYMVWFYKLEAFFPVIWNCDDTLSKGTWNYILQAVIWNFIYFSEMPKTNTSKWWFFLIHWDLSEKDG